MKKLTSILFALAVGGVVLLATPALAKTKTGNVEIFYRDDCPHCHDEKKFLTEQKIPYNILNLSNVENRQLFDQITKEFKLSKSTPITIIGKTLIVGFATEKTTGNTIKTTYNNSDEFWDFKRALITPDKIDVITSTEGVCDATTQCKTEKTINLPLIGKLNTEQYSLGSLSLILGTVDGFNPCAMAVLIALLAGLIATRDRKKMILFAGLFLLAEALMYYLILMLWYSVWDFVGLNQIVTPLLGLLAVGSGVYFLYRFGARKNVCNLGSVEKKRGIEDKISKIAKMSFGIIPALIIIGIAFSVNIIEFACSIGIPQTYTKILELNNLSFFPRAGQMFVYIIGYMLDDLVVFGLAIFAVGKLSTGNTQKFIDASLLIGGILMALIGLAMLFKPSLLIF